MTRTKGEVTAMAWLLLVTAGLFETGFAVFLKLSHGMSRPWPTAAGAATVGMVLLGDAVSSVKLVSIGLVLAGVIGLNLSGVTP